VCLSAFEYENNYVNYSINVITYFAESNLSIVAIQKSESKSLNMYDIHNNLAKCHNTHNNR